MADHWTPAEDELLSKLYAEGVTFSAMAAQLNKTRNAVIGRAHRRKFPGRPMGGIRKRRISTAPEPKAKTAVMDISVSADRSKNVRGGTVAKARLKPPKAVKLPRPTADAAALFDSQAMALPLEDIGFRQCRFIVSGERQDARFCGIETSPKSSWCDHHRARVFGGYQAEEVAA